MTTIYKFKAYYTDAGVGAVQDPAPTCTVINMADDSKLADAQATTASTNMPGLYSYEYSGNDGLDCVAWFKTTDTGCDVKELASYVSEKITTNLPAIKTDTAAILLDTGTDGVVLKAAGLDTDAVNEIVDQVWNEAIADHTTATTFGGKNQKVVPSETINDYKADVSGLATSAELTAIKGAGWSTETLAAIDVLIDAIKAKTDNLPASPAATGAKMDLIDAPNSIAVTAIQNGLSKPGTAQTISSNSDISAIKLKTDNLPSDPADQSAVEAAISAIPAGISAEDVMTAIVEGAITLRDSLKLHNAFVAGKVSGGGTESISFRDLADTLDRILMTVDTSGNRTNVTKDLSDD